jgi:ADP-ribosyl-[dinitrogen reductase] hydrolase
MEGAEKGTQRKKMPNFDSLRVDGATPPSPSRFRRFKISAEDLVGTASYTLESTNWAWCDRFGRRMSELYQQQVDCALAASRAAGDLLRLAFRDGYAGDLDKAAEWLIRDVLLGAFPSYGYRGEETGFSAVRGEESKHLWLVDPLDGTSAAKRGFRGAAVSIALLREGVPVLGVVYAYAAPDHAGDLFWWSEGLRGVVRNGRVITRTWPRKASYSGTALISQDADRAPGLNQELVAPMRYRTIPGIAYRLALVASGEGDVAISLNSPTSWDFAGGHALLLGAGGELFDQHGHAVTYDREGRVRNSLWACFGGTRDVVQSLVLRDWNKIHGAKTGDSAENRLCYLKPREVVVDGGLLSRAQGCLLGQLAGDALGSLVEFQNAESIRQKYPDGPRLLLDGGSWNTIAGQPTDDSELALALARSIVAGNGYDGELAARAYAGWYASGPFDIGNTTRSALGPARKAVEGGLPAATAARAAANSESQANGALMRVSPLGIFGAGISPDVVFDYARADAALTHPHAVCRDANGVLAATIAFAIREGGGLVDAYEFAIGMATRKGVEAKVLEALQDAAVNAPRDYYSQQGWVLIALQNAFYQLLHAGFEDGVMNSVRAGGDTDTNGAIAGALLGSVHGRAAVPGQWRDRVLTCRPMRGVAGVAHARPAEFWPVDALCLAERLVLAGGYAE